MQAFRTIVARFAGTCARCGKPFPVGARIRYGYRKAYHLSAECPQVQAENEWSAANV